MGVVSAKWGGGQDYILWQCMVEEIAGGASEAEAGDRAAAILNAEFPEFQYTKHQCRQKYLALTPEEHERFRQEQRIEALKQDTKEQGAKQRRRKEDKRIAFYEMLTDAIADAVRPIEWTQPEFKPPKIQGSPEEAVLMLSDWHFGERTESYNMETARARMEILAQKVMAIAGLHRKAYPVPKLNIFFLGDIVDGSNIYPTQPHHIETHAVSQVFDNQKAISDALCNFATFFNEVECWCVRGNHGRISKFAHEGENWDVVMYKTLEAATQYIPNIKWNITQDWKQIAQVQNTRFLLMHGDQIKMHMNIPWYGITNRASRLATTRTLSDFDAICMGHFHTDGFMSWNDKRIISNGTAVDGDQFPLEKLGMESAQFQQFFGVSKRRITWHYPLDFEED